MKRLTLLAVLLLIVALTLSGMGCSCGEEGGGGATATPIVTATPKPTPTPLITPTPTPKATPTPLTYIEFTNPMNIFSVEYPSTWEPSTYASDDDFFDTIPDDYFNSSTVQVGYSTDDYQSTLSYYLSDNTGPNTYTLVAKNPEVDSTTYSVFISTWGNDSEELYICDANPGTVRIYLNPPYSMQSYSQSLSSITDLETIENHILHMIASFHLNGVPALRYTDQSHPPSLSDKTINPTTGVYKNYYLGLVYPGPEGGAGCYDDGSSKFLVLINNRNASNPTYDQLVTFLQQDRVDQYPYTDTSSTLGSYTGSAERLVDLENIQNIIDGTTKPKSPVKCGDFAERLHNDAEMAGIRCGYVLITTRSAGGIPLSPNHACNFFQTTDRGVVYIDVTGSVPNIPHPTRAVKTVNIIEGQEYIPVSLFPEAGFQDTYDSIGAVVVFVVTFDGVWQN